MKKSKIDFQTFMKEQTIFNSIIYLMAYKDLKKYGYNEDDLLDFAIDNLIKNRKKGGDKR